MSKKSQHWIKECVNYWSSRIYEGDLGVDFSEAHERCWRCGYKRKAQKCHIVPKSLGGSEKPSNLIPLCAQCHDEAPDVSEVNEMFDWIKKDCATFYDTFWEDRALMDAISNGVDLNHIKSFEDVVKYFARYCFLLENNISYHVSQGTGGIRLKTSTKSWIIRKASNFDDEIFKGNGEKIKELEAKIRKEQKHLKCLIN
ncbi:MAG: HNH endonuclease [Candidatus Lokiarchaeota archaeon]|nr:HNH endonuclease [Candidatus Lokiarchaeota archaeon]